MNVKIVHTFLSTLKTAPKFVDFLENLKPAFDKRRYYDILSEVILTQAGGLLMDRFDLESKITKTSIFADHLRDLSCSILEHDLSTDEITNALEGLAVLIESHERVLFDTFVQAFKLDGYKEDGVAI
jgi:hypothetical protein